MFWLIYNFVNLEILKQHTYLMAEYVFDKFIVECNYQIFASFAIEIVEVSLGVNEIVFET